MKKCISCKKEKDLSNFSKSKNNKDGLKTYCKKCASEQNKKYREKNRSNINKKKRQEYHISKINKEERTEQEIKNGGKVCTVCNSYKEIDNFYKRGNGGFYNYCKKCALKSQKRYTLKNRSKINNRKREYYKNNKKKFSDYYHEYNKNNKEYNRQKAKKWAESNKERYRENQKLYAHKRRVLLKNVKHDFNKEEWKKCQEFFSDEKGKYCAYCGKHTENITLDHVIPVIKNGSHTKENILPSCSNCNSQKSSTDFLKWYKGTDFYCYEKLEKINNYFDKMI